MFLYLFFAVAAFAECETGTCMMCKTNSSCDWYGFDCLSKTSTTVTTLSLTASATCDVCQAGNCTDCQYQDGCSWFKSTLPGIPGKCAVNTTESSVYEVLDVCPTCLLTSTCDGCVVRDNGTECGWYVLPGNVGGKCREASPSFAYSKVPADSCSAGNPCSGVNTCSKCQDVQNKANATICNWFTSKSPSIYNSKCDDKSAGVVDKNLYTQISGTCPACAGVSCVDCKAEAGCKWVAVQGLTGIGFGQCLTVAAVTPSAKKVIDVCPTTCKVHSCLGCAAISSCIWFTGSSFIDDSCDLATDAKLQHPVQTPISSPGSCGVCQADRCYECNNLPNCGWYAKKLGFATLAEGCYATASPPSGRVLVSNTDSKCGGVPSGSVHVAASVGLLFVLAFVA